VQPPLRILLVEDNPGDARLTQVLLAESTASPFDVTHVASLAAAFDALDADGFDVILLDLSLPDAHGLAGVVAMRTRRPRLPVVVLSGLDDEAVSLEALQNGAQDYLVKGQGDGITIARAVRYATERKRTELQLVEEKERADVANRAKSQLLANMSHELRTPLNAIIGFAEILKSDIPLTEARRTDYAKTIHESGMHLLTVINDILDLSKIEAGRVELREELVDLRRAIEACVTIIGERVTEGGLTLDVQIVPELPSLRADESKVKQILLNLMSNAVKFTPKGGRVALAAVLASDGGLQISVEDTGIGMAEEDIPRALAPFTQIDSELHRKYQGTGLGLPLTKSLIELHGGRFEIRSAVGVGTTVIVHLPSERLIAAARVAV
jgi:signal transduction histidine kinase